MKLDVFMKQVQLMYEDRYQVVYAACTPHNATQCSMECLTWNVVATVQGAAWAGTQQNLVGSACSAVTDAVQVLPAPGL